MYLTPDYSLYLVEIKKSFYPLSKATLSKKGGSIMVEKGR